MYRNPLEVLLLAMGRFDVFTAAASTYWFETTLALDFSVVVRPLKAKDSCLLRVDG